MPLTRSTAAQRAATAAATQAATRTIELAALLAATLVTVVAVALAAQARLAAVAGIDEALKDGRAVDLRTVDWPDPLLPLLEPVIPDSSERRFVAERLGAWLNAGDEGGRRRVASAGSLATARVEEGQVPRTRRLPQLRERLDAARATRPPRAAGAPAEPLTIPLLTGAQLAAIRPALVVRRPADFRWGVVGALLVFLLPFYAVHAWLRLRGSQADRLLLPAVHLLAGIGLALMVGLRDPVRDALLFGRFAQGVAAGCLVLALAASYDVQRSPVRRLSYIPLLGAVGLSALSDPLRQRPGNERRQGEPAGDAAGRGHPAAGRLLPRGLLRATVGVPARAERAAPGEARVRVRRAAPRLRGAGAGRGRPRPGVLLPPEGSRPGAGGRLPVPVALRRRAGPRHDGGGGPAAARRRLRRGLRPRLPAHRGRARADVGVAVEQRRAGGRPARPLLLGAEHRRAHRHRPRPRGSGPGAGGAHRPGPGRARRGAGAGGPRGRPRPAGVHRVAVASGSRWARMATTASSWRSAWASGSCCRSCSSPAACSACCR